MRKQRIWYPQARYHIMARGNYRQNIVRDDADRYYFLELLRVSVVRYRCVLFCFVLMDNHYHWLLETGKNTPVWEIMKYFDMNYSCYFNRKYGLTGHLFQGRYKACLVENEAYFLQTSRYIHLNPVKAGMAALPEQYRWGSYRTYLGMDRMDFVNTSEVLSSFGRQKVSNYRKFIENKRGQERDNLDTLRTIQKFRKALQRKAFRFLFARRYTQ